MILEAGELDQRATLQVKGDQRNDYGELSQDVYLDRGTTNVKLGNITPKIAEIAKGFSQTANMEAKMRYRPEITNDYQLVIKGQIYQVDGVIHDPSNQRAWTQVFLTKIQ